MTAAFYAVALVVVHVMYDDKATHAQQADGAETGRVTFRNVLAFQNFILMMGVIFGLQFVDRSFGPVLPLYVEQMGTSAARVPIVAGALFSIMAFTGALGHHFCGKLLRRHASRTVIAGGAAVAAAGSLLFGLSGSFWIMSAASVLLGLGMLTSASLVGMASSPFIAGVVGGSSIRVVFFADLAIMGLLALLVQNAMVD